MINRFDAPTFRFLQVAVNLVQLQTRLESDNSFRRPQLPACRFACDYAAHQAIFQDKGEALFCSRIAFVMTMITTNGANAKGRFCRSGNRPSSGLPFRCDAHARVFVTPSRYNGLPDRAFGPHVDRKPFREATAAAKPRQGPLKPVPASRKARIVEIDGEDAGQRLDNFLIRILKGLPRPRVYRIIRRGEVRVNGGRVEPARKLAFGDRVRIPPVAHLPERAATSRPETDLSRRILFMNEGLIVIDKPAGLASHGGSGISYGAIETLRQNLPGERRLELVHRLDRETSGCLMIARKRAYLRLLQDALRGKRLTKHYLAVVHGSLARRPRHIDAPLLTRTRGGGEKVTSVNQAGKPAQTRVRGLQANAGLTLIEASPLTGRTHQIRVHTRHLGHPVVGDRKYGDPLLDESVMPLVGRRPGLFLHAARLEIPALADWPSVEVQAPVSASWRKDLGNIFDLKEAVRFDG